MSVTLHLGVIDQPYTETQSGTPKPPRITRKGRLHRSTAKAAARALQGRAAPKKVETTGDVAEVLEAKYGVMAAFYENHQGDILAAFHDSLAGALENLHSGAPVGNDPLGTAASDVEQMFKRFLSNRDMDGLVEGVPTAASLAGVNHRLKHPYAKSNPSRSSFIDTGLYEASFKAWID